MTSYSYIELTEFVYIKLKGLIWISNGLVNPNKLEKNGAEKLIEIYTSSSQSKPLIIDCKGIISVIDHSWDELFIQATNLKRQIIFINYNGLEQELGNRTREFCKGLKVLEEKREPYLTIYNSEESFKLQANHIADVKKQILDKVRSFVELSFCEFESKNFEYLKSTPILASGEFNASSIISNPESFYWTALALTDAVEEIVQQFQIGSIGKKPRILSVSLRSAPFANIISLFLGYYLETIDHFGPINKFFEIENLDNSGVEYIYIGDFTFGGTEIKISQNYVSWNNAKLEHAVVIGSLFPKEIFTSFKLHPLIQIKGIGGSQHKLFNE